MWVSVSGQARIVALLMVSLFLCSGLQATEPHVAAVLVTEWDETGEILRLSVIPDRLMTDVTLRLEIPEMLAMEPGAGPFQDRFQERVARDGFRTLEAGLGAIPGRSVLQFSFRPSGHQAHGGVVAFILEGTTADGIPVRDAISIAVGHPGERPVRRHGAVEFPAVSLPGEPQ
jgi:hypothetical protein